MTTPTTPTEPRLSVAIIGVGTMGSAMARRLLAADFPVAVWSRHPETASSLIERGATPHVDARDAVADADVVITMLPTPDATRNLMIDSQTLAAMRANATWVQMGTIGVDATRSLMRSSSMLRPDVQFVDAPVSGSREPAETGNLVILASGNAPAQALLEPIFSVLGKSTKWLGAAGAGSGMKLVMNTWLAFQIEGAAESLSLAQRFGLDTDQLFDVLCQSPLASEYALAKLSRMADENFTPDFAIDLALKDLTLVAGDADPRSAPVAAAIAQRWRQVIAEGGAGLDVSAAFRGLSD
jgi:3-hydroxyisobutyrate dehydrogenase